MRVNCIQLLTFIFSLSCVSIVFYQGYNCWIKYKSNPQTTQVSIEKATRFPDITFCPHGDFYKKRNNDCNISAFDYFINNQWNGTLNCSDPIKLHKSIVGDVKDLVSSISLYDEDLANSKNVDLDNPSNFRIIDFPNGRCYTLRWDITFDTFSVYIFFLGQTSVSIHAPENFLENRDKSIVELGTGTYTNVKVLYETFKVLSFDGETCQNDEAYSRDDCLYSAIQEVTTTKYKNRSQLYFHIIIILQESEKELGCTTPFHPDKSNICVKDDKKLKARGIFNNITRINQTKARRLCPKHCQQYITSLNKEGRNTSSSYTSLEIIFPKYIRVSSSNYSYTILELLAEVGGYVGLFLGISIIQISGLMKILITKLNQYVKNWRENSPN